MNPAFPSPNTPQASIYSQGFRPYTGPRGGLLASMWTVAVQSIRYVLGIGRGVVPKIAPIILVILRSANAFFFVAIAFAFGGEMAELVGIGYASHVSGSMDMVVLFTALAAPGILVGDRRSGMFDMYMTTNLTKTNYLASKAAGLTITLTVFVILPAVVTLAGFSLLGLGPDGVVAWVKTAARLIIASAVIGLLFTSVAMALSAVTKRALLAGLAIIGVLAGGGLMAAIVTEGLGYGQEWALLSVVYTAVAATDAVFGEPITGNPDAGWVWAATAAHIIVPAIVVMIAYRRVGGER